MPAEALAKTGAVSGSPLIGRTRWRGVRLSRRRPSPALAAGRGPRFRICHHVQSTRPVRLGLFPGKIPRFPSWRAFRRNRRRLRRSPRRDRRNRRRLRRSPRRDRRSQRRVRRRTRRSRRDPRRFRRTARRVWRVRRALRRLRRCSRRIRRRVRRCRRRRRRRRRCSRRPRRPVRRRRRPVRREARRGRRSRRHVCRLRRPLRRMQRRTRRMRRAHFRRRREHFRRRRERFRRRRRRILRHRKPLRWPRRRIQSRRLAWPWRCHRSRPRHLRTQVRRGRLRTAWDDPRLRRAPPHRRRRLSRSRRHGLTILRRPPHLRPRDLSRPRNGLRARPVRPSPRRERWAVTALQAEAHRAGAAGPRAVGRLRPGAQGVVRRARSSIAPPRASRRSASHPVRRPRLRRKPNPGPHDRPGFPRTSEHCRLSATPEPAWRFSCTPRGPTRDRSGGGAASGLSHHRAHRLQSSVHSHLAVTPGGRRICPDRALPWGIIAYAWSSVRCQRVEFRASMTAWPRAGAIAEDGGMSGATTDLCAFIASDGNRCAHPTGGWLACRRGFPDLAFEAVVMDIGVKNQR